MDSEEAIQFTELENIKCMVQEYPLEKANEAFGRSRHGGSTSDLGRHIADK